MIWTEVRGLDHLVDALMGSTALPIMFPPNGSYFDGGVFLNQPITPAIQLREPDILYVVIPSSEALGRTGDVLAIAQTLTSTWISSSLTSQLDRLKLVNRMRGDRDARKLPVCVIRPPEDLDDSASIYYRSEIASRSRKGWRGRCERKD